MKDIHISYQNKNLQGIDVNILLPWLNLAWEHMCQYTADVFIHQKGQANGMHSFINTPKIIKSTRKLAWQFLQLPQHIQACFICNHCCVYHIYVLGGKTWIAIVLKAGLKESWRP